MSAGEHYKLAVEVERPDGAEVAVMVTLTPNSAPVVTCVVSDGEPDSQVGLDAGETVELLARALTIPSALAEATVRHLVGAAEALPALTRRVGGHR